MRKIIGALALGAISLIGQDAAGTGLGIAVKELHCEYATNPLGIDTPHPRFSWILESARRGQLQSAYQILVASSERELQANRGDKWDSGKIASDESVNIAYQGKALSSGEKCYWKVRVWDGSDQPSEYSAPATFEMGLLEQQDWQGDWLGWAEPPAPLDKIEGKFGEAVELDGVSECVKIEHYPQLKPKAQITICAWVKPGKNIGEGWREVYRKEDGDARQLLALGRTGDAYAMWLGLGIDGSYSEDRAWVDLNRFRDDNWHFIAATYDGSAKTFYADGKQVGSVEASGPIDDYGSSAAYIGSLNSNMEFFKGGIDDVRVYSRALSAKEIEAMTDKRAGGDPQLVGWWKLDGDLKNSAEVGAGDGSFSTGPPVCSVLLRKEIEVSGKVTNARAYISGLGWYELYINGKKVGDHVLDPATTDYHKRVLYATYDVTEHLRQGSNAIGIALGNGWYCEPRRLKYGDSPRAQMQMKIELADGNAIDVKTDKTWKASSGPITRNDIYGGEIYDARLEQSGWTAAGYDDAEWGGGEIKENPGGKMQSQLMPAIKVIETIKPVKLTNPQPGVYVYDMGQLFGGWARLRVKGPSGAKVTIKYAARMFDNGLVDKRRHGGRGETDHYILKGGGEETYEPKFTYHPVQYVQIEGYPGEPTLEDLEGRVVHSAVDLSGDFECSSEMVNRIHQNTVWTVRNGLFGIPLDCLHREHWAWTDPATITGMVYPRKHSPLFWTKWLNDIADAQHEDGGVPDVAPSYAFDQCDPAWGGNYPIFVWYLHQYYGDKRIVEEHYGGMKKCVDYLTSTATDHLMKKGHYGDHMLPGDAPGEEEFISTETPRELVWSGYYYRGALVVSMAAKLLGKTADAKHYAQLAENIKNAFNKEWLNTETSLYASGSQTANIFPLALEIVPEANRAGVLKNVVRNITEERNGHLRTGNTGTTCMIGTLGRLGQGEALYQAATSPDYPGWGYMVAQGATTIWERWGLGGDAESMIMWATIDEFFYNDIAGIGGPEYYGADTMAPGFRELNIRPQLLGDLTYARASFRTVRGVVSSSWKKDGDSLLLEVVLPVNTRGKVSVPKLGLKDVTITESGKTVWKAGKFIAGAEGIAAAQDSDDCVTFAVGSGAYSFKSD
ncbi:family 78 glycoside hydrolase catalytic domain [Candidatus Sumerlaeota bacterium]